MTNAPTPQHRATMRGDIEGLRAIAVGFVLLYHLFPKHLVGGFAGVDVFFVISGFLITSQLLKEVARSGSVSLTGFYARRARRLLPAATAVLIFSALAGWAVLPKGQLRDLGNDVIAAALYVVNWALALRSVDYLAEDAAPSVVQHYWSLSVEEQFYVVWPLLILLGAKVARRLKMAVKPLLFMLLLATTVASLAWSAYYTHANAAQAYFVTTSRVWELGIGALSAFMAVGFAKLGRPIRELMAAVGIVMIALCGLVITDTTPWPGLSALLPTIGTALVILAGSAGQDTIGARLLGIRPMVWIGGLSYAVYLWHWPLIVLAQNKWPAMGVRGLVVVAIVSVGAAWLSQHFVENPIRFHPVLSKSTRWALVMGAVAMVLSVLAGLLVRAQQPELRQGDEVLAWSDGALTLAAPPTGVEPLKLKKDYAAAIPTSGEIYPDPSLAHKDIPAVYGMDCQMGGGETTPRDDCVVGNPSGSVRVALVGDSKATQWVDALTEIGAAHDWRIELYLKGSCSFNEAIPLEAGKPFPECGEFVRNSIARLQAPEHRPDVVIVSGVRSSRNFRAAKVDQDTIDAYVKSLTALRATGAKVVTIADNPSSTSTDFPAGKTVDDCLVQTKGEDFSKCSFPSSDGHGTPALRQASARVPGVQFVSMNQWICPDQKVCPAVIGDVLVYRQGSHLTNTYVRTLAPILSRELLAVGVVDSALPLPAK